MELDDFKTEPWRLKEFTNGEITDEHSSIEKLNSDLHCQKKVPVVLLTRLPEYKVSTMRPLTPQQFYSEAESDSSSDSDMQWEPESSDSDFSVTNKKKKAAAKVVKTKTENKSQPEPARPSTSRIVTNNASAGVSSPVIVSSAFSNVDQETTTARPDLPEPELTVDMVVLARKRPMKWLQGKIVELVVKTDGRLKYKVGFDEKGKSLVSGHHIAFHETPKLEELYVGARVVVRSEENRFRFLPGILGELPSRKNRLRFLVFLDNHTPVYAGLPLLHRVCKPLDDSLDDLMESTHKTFMAQYLQNWPYPHLTQYRTGQNLNVLVNEELQNCEVLNIDCSLMEVIFTDTQQKEWIYRGSIRLEHMTKFLELKEDSNAASDD
ncbi:histone-lysine N-methyltransferase SETDB1-B-like [Gouania willdenowi]|uniref:histone-lysine N-methyltransferase SETDB1-B-like n=1 Tax=Gouania willdenowi TaxID=441366 RepID=UPI0010568660|nr:histone-lysine N-methyltransferase SETDB1-B-like [Gouania willdenowi]XP_028317199.1 histone-lysine N-methyltransferase SETDB1-B-like [Gouania willdenowi]